MSRTPLSLFPGIALRVLALVAIVIAGTWVAHSVRQALDLTVMPDNEQMVHGAIMLGSLAYVVLLAIPFVPGAEVGIAMLTAFGASIAPLVYVATVTSLMSAYLIGRLIPISYLLRLLKALHMQRAADLVARAAALPHQDRLAMLMESTPPQIVALALRHRYIALALSVNIPGNAVIGGGGGIMLMAGMSGIFSPLATFLAVAIAVSPVPLAVTLLGAG